MTRQLDALFVQPNSTKIYQALRNVYSAIEPPTWSLLLAEACRRKGFGVEILDCDAENLTDSQAVERIRESNPKLVVFVVYGSEPSQGTVRMSGAVPLVQLLKLGHPEYKTAIVGTHASAVPEEVNALGCFDYTIVGEGVYTLQRVLSNLTKLANGILYGRNVDQIDRDLPGYAWDLLPKKEKPFDLYRSHFWHAGYKHENRTPFAALYTSLGCPYRCGFCVINLVNRTDPSPAISSADSNTFRYWSAGHSFKQIYTLVTMGVKTIRISDEMFLLRPQHYEPLLTKLRDHFPNELNLWAYARVDTVKPDRLKLLRDAGMRWLCLGIESSDQIIRREVSKGSYKEVNIRQVVREVEDAGIEIIANYIFGLPGDTMESMQKTLDFSIELNTSMWNAYACMPLPGTPLYQEAKQKGVALPSSYEGFGFLSYESLPLPTETLTAADVLRFRDEAFVKYWNRPEFLDKICRKFGPDAVRNIENMLKIKLKRKLLGD